MVRNSWMLIVAVLAANAAGANDLKELYELALTRDASLQAAAIEPKSAIKPNGTISRSRSEFPDAPHDETFCLSVRRSFSPATEAVAHRAGKSPLHWSRRWRGRRLR